MITLKLEPGKYIIAVSGGVDSVALLDLLSKVPNVNLTVAHFDHGIRKNSALDKEFVEKLAKHYGLIFRHAEGKLGEIASEATARQARYDFLYQVRNQVAAQAIIIAHHQDDVLETAILNWLRGTGRRGLSSLRSTSSIIRPLLQVPKSDITSYARLHKLQWREDSTNQNERYLRNYVRSQIVSKLSPKQRTELLAIIQKALLSNRVIDEDLTQLLSRHAQSSQLNREWFIQLPHSVSKEILLAWFRQNGVYQVERKRLEQLVVAAKTYQPDQQADINKNYWLRIKLNHLALEPRDR